MQFNNNSDWSKINVEIERAKSNIKELIGKTNVPDNLRTSELSDVLLEFGHLVDKYSEPLKRISNIIESNNAYKLVWHSLDDPPTRPVTILIEFKNCERVFGRYDTKYKKYYDNNDIIITNIKEIVGWSYGILKEDK